jgi:exonuclease SbcD
MDWAADRMIEEKVDICLFAGDAFKDSRIMLDRARVEIAAFLGWIHKLQEADIALAIISGTPSHDAIDAYSLIQHMVDECRVDILTEPRLIDVPQVRAFNPETGAFADGVYEVNIACLPGLNRSNILTREEFQGKSSQEIHRIMTDKITDITQGMLAGVDNDCPTILLSHMTYSEASTGFDHLLLEHEPLLTPEAVEGYDLVCLGHIHRPQNIRNKVFYSGSPERLSFNDENVTPGFWIHELAGKGQPVESRFIKTPAREFVTLEALPDDFHAEDFSWRGRQVSAKDAIVRIHIKAADEQAKLLDRKRIEKAFYDAGAFYVSEIAIDVERTERARDETVTESLAPVAAVEKWGEQQGLDTGEIAALIAMANALIELEVAI